MTNLYLKKLSVLILNIIKNNYVSNSPYLGLVWVINILFKSTSKDLLLSLEIILSPQRIISD